MRVLSQREAAPEAATDAGVVLLPVRCTATARLKGFEVLTCELEPGGSASPRLHVPKYSRAAAGQLAHLLSGELAPLMAGHGLQLWIPLSLDALRRDATVLFDGIRTAGLAGKHLTFELEARDILAGVAPSEADLLAALTARDSRIAVSALTDFESIEAALRVDGRIDEVRMSATLCSAGAPAGRPVRADGRWLAETVERLHERGLLMSARDVSDAKLCHEVIVAGFDLIQGDMVGRAHSVEATINQMVAALPFGRTLL